MPDSPVHPQSACFFLHTPAPDHVTTQALAEMLCGCAHVHLCVRACGLGVHLCVCASVCVHLWYQCICVCARICVCACGLCILHTAGAKQMCLETLRPRHRRNLSNGSRQTHSGVALYTVVSSPREDMRFPCSLPPTPALIGMIAEPGTETSVLLTASYQVQLLEEFWVLPANVPGKCLLRFP